METFQDLFFFWIKKSIVNISVYPVHFKINKKFSQMLTLKLKIEFTETLVKKLFF